MLVQELDLRTDWRIVVAGFLRNLSASDWETGAERIARKHGRTVAKWTKLLAHGEGSVNHKQLRQGAPWQVLLIALCDDVVTLRGRTEPLTADLARDVMKTSKPIAELLIARLPKNARWRGERLYEEIVRICDEGEQLEMQKQSA